MRDLNARYRHIDKPTDVLSFAQDQELTPPGAPKLLGDVVIAIETAEHQAVVAGHTLDEEMCHLVIHGVLHLLGYDDATPEGYAEMVGKGKEIWQRIESECAVHLTPSRRQRPDEQ